ncbi:LysM peptidoglycan-binding domain-containing protein [Lapidilactobacillus wuchangensis]|uniref:LysM peptidoglycan-binding domain-containing protein n=1 Tax=Lapidilactobacillus wuchangensis TaxID=2486001 RepID=UPI000F76D8F1|nr:LysM peptidoglycan-binding domain-containing protein [Lapidilactobacillus wuchangensis]
MKLNKKVVTMMTAAAVVIFMSAPINQVAAAKGDHGVDWSKYQGSHGVYGYQQDKFVISQVGGYYNGQFIDQLTYQTQVSSAIAAGKRAHTYIYSQFSGREQADAMLNYYLPKIQTPKGSIVALDVESGQPDTDSVIYALNRIKAAGYTAVLYGYKNFLVSHINLSTVAAQYPLWLAEYPDYNVTPDPNYNYFPSYDNVGIFQFTSTYIGGGLDGNIDLTGVTDNGYGGNIKTNSGKVVVKPNSTTSAINVGQSANNTAKANIKSGDTVKVNLTATKWANGVGMPAWVRGKTYQVQQVSGNKVLLAGIMSWANKSDVELLSVGSTSTPATNSANSYTVQYGDSWWAIANKFGINMYSLAAVNGKTINTVIYPGQRLTIGSATVSSARTYTVKYGDSWWLIGSKLGISMYTLAAKNGKTINSMIHPNQILMY